MQTLVYRPQPPLDLYVDRIWYSSSPEVQLSGLSLPILHPELVLNFSDHFAMLNADRQSLLTDAVCWAGGLQTRPLHAVAQGRHEMLGVLFKPWGLSLLLGVPAEEVTNQYLPLYSVFGAEGRQLLQQVAEAATADEKVRRLEAFLRRRYAAQPVPATVREAVRLLNRLPMGDGAISTVARQLGVTGKALSQAFRKHVGVSPRHYWHLQAINRLLPALAADELSLTAVTYDHHFFDQAHFSRLFRQVTGLTPSLYRKQAVAGRVRPPYLNFLEDLG